MIKSQLLFVTKAEQTLYSFQRLVKAFKTGAHSIIKSFKASSTLKTVFCYGLKTNNRLNVRINRLFWFHSKSTIKNSFQPFSKHLRVKQSVVSTKQQVVFSLSLKNTFNSKGLRILKLWIQSRVDLHR